MFGDGGASVYQLVVPGGAEDPFAGGVHQEGEVNDLMRRVTELSLLVGRLAEWP